MSTPLALPSFAQRIASFVSGGATPKTPDATQPAKDTTSTSKDAIERSPTPSAKLAKFEGARHVKGGSEVHVHEDHVSGGGRGDRKTTKFDTTNYALTKPAKGVTTKSIDADLDKKFTKGHATAGVKSGSEEERRVKYALFQVSDGVSKNSKLNVLVPDVDGKGTTGRVRITTDKAGKPTAELLGTGAPATPNRFADAAAAKAALKKDFKLKDVSEGPGATWSKADLEKTYEAFSKLSAKEKTALEGVDLRREVNNGTTASPDRVGYFEWKVGTDAQGKTNRSDVLSLDDRVFDSDKKTFSGTNNPASYRTIQHEVGHAVETKKSRDSLYSFNTSIDAYNAKLDEYKAASPADQKAMRPELTRLQADMKAKKKTWKAAAGKNGDSQELLDFKKYVKANKIEAPTDYAATGLDDFFAESFMLYKTDPDGLKASNPKLHAYFAKDKHL